MSNLVKYTLDAEGKVRIPVGSAGKKQLTINKLNDEINNIPDTSSISVEIESKQGLLPPARVTPKPEYPFSITMNQGWTNTMMGVPLECNGFIPDYIDTTNLTSGDRVYIIDPKHDDTSKYVLGDDKKWMYVGNYNDPEIGGVEGNDYSTIASTQGGMWLIRQNPKNGEEPVSFEMRQKVLPSDDFNMEQAVEIYEGDATGTNRVKSNMIVNPFSTEIQINDLVFDGTIDKNDRIQIPNGTITINRLIYQQAFGGWVYSHKNPESGRTEYLTDAKIGPGMSFWYDRRGTTPLTIRFK